MFHGEFRKNVDQLHSAAGEISVTHWLQLGSSEALAPYASRFDDVVDSMTQQTPTVAAGGSSALLLMYTSGTTGRPKGVVHTHESAIWATFNLDANSSFRDGDKYLTPMPMFHTGGLTPLSVNVYRGVTSCVIANFDAELTWKLIEKERVTTGFLVPTMLQFMLDVEGYQKRFDCSSLRWIMSGGAPVTSEIARPYADLGIRILQAYGLTETCGMTSIMDMETALEKPESIGKETFHVEVRIVNEKNESCTPGEPGELIARGKSVFREYWNDPAATRETIRDGWLHTGDVAVMDDAGYVFIRDRLKNMIISGGENIYPAEIERTLLEHPKIAEAAVIGQKSERWGESPVAIIVPRDRSLTKDEVLEFCRSKLAGYKRPKRIEFVDTLPRNPLGKIVKYVLKQQFPQEASE
jgi:acyl-CoA synthetase (AMP-forming)/AMP-acid ligase II